MKFEIQRKDFRVKKYSMSFIRYFLILNFIRKDNPLKFKMQTFKIKDNILNVKFSSNLIQRVILFHEFHSLFLEIYSLCFEFHTLFISISNIVLWRSKKNLWSPKIKSVEI